MTKICSKAIGICYMLRRFSPVVLGIIGVAALQWLDGNGLYLVFVMFSAFSWYATYTMPFCMSNREG